jgi:alpha-tubulin suppressor-like RCC1 family protein
MSTVQNPVIKTIAAGSNHIMALKTDGTVWVCGNNSYGQLGLGDYSSRNRFTQVPIYDADQIFTGDASSFIKLKDGTVWGTGNAWGQLGLGTKNAMVDFTRVPFLDDVTQIAITYSEVFVLKPDGTVWGAGKNTDKILLQGDYDLRASFVKIPVSNVKQLRNCGLDVLVQKDNGELWGWGTNPGGELGVGDNQPHRDPVLIPAPATGIAKLFTGPATTFIIDNNGKVWTAGANVRGQLGLNDLKSRYTFTQVPFFDTRSVDVIAPHSASTSFRETNGNVWNVGDNVYGQMGLGNVATLPDSLPKQIIGFTGSSLAGRGSTAFAIKSNGTLWGWGSNSSGALGTGIDTTYSASPIQIK